MAVRSIPSVQFAPSATLRAVANLAWRQWCAMLRARRSRRLLVEMDDRLLADIGLGRGAARFEAARPMWDLTPTRR